jgi:DNA-binding NarL/FixJ family response regulator
VSAHGTDAEPAIDARWRSGRITHRSHPPSREHHHAPADAERRGVGAAAIRVAVCEEHEIIQAGLVASLNDDPAFAAAVMSPEHVAAAAVDVAIVSSRVARDTCLPSPLVIVSEDTRAQCEAAPGNDVAGIVSRRSITVSQLRATVHAAAAGLRVHAPQGDGVQHPAIDPRGLRVLELLADGLATREVAARMNYSERTIKTLINDIQDLLGARTRAQAVAYAIRRGLL